MHIVMMISFIMYLVGMFGIAWAAVRRHGTTHHDSFMLGGRSLGYIVTALSAHAADMSDWLFMGLPGAIYAVGMFKCWVAISLVIGMFLSWHFIAGPLRIATHAYDSNTLSTYFARRFNDTSGLISIASALIVVFFFTIYLAVGIKGAGYVLNLVFGIPYLVGALLGTVMVILYSVIGGYVAVAWVDAFQAIFLLAAIIATPLYAYLTLPHGIADIINAAQLHGISLHLLPTSWYSFLQVALGPCGWALGYFGMPHILSKFMGARDPQELYKSKYIGMVWQIVALSAAVAVGFVGLAYFPMLLARPELIFITMTMQLFIPFIAGLILCGFLAATFSTMDSQVLVLAGLIADDIYKNFVNRVATAQQMLMIYRFAIIVALTAAFVIAADPQRSTIFGLVEYAWSGIGASFGPLVILSLYSNAINKYGAMTGILAGGTVAAIWRFCNWMPAGIEINAIIPGFLVGAVTIVAISALTRKSAQ